MPATPAAELPKAYVLRLRIGRYRRIVQLIDAAGELFYDSQRSADLVYLGAANTFVMVIDPLSINDFGTACRRPNEVGSPRIVRSLGSHSRSTSRRRIGSRKWDSSASRGGWRLSSAGPT